MLQRRRYREIGGEKKKKEGKAGEPKRFAETEERTEMDGEGGGREGMLRRIPSENFRFVV